MGREKEKDLHRGPPAPKKRGRKKAELTEAEKRAKAERKKGERREAYKKKVAGKGKKDRQDMVLGHQLVPVDDTDESDE